MKTNRLTSLSAAGIALMMGALPFCFTLTATAAPERAYNLVVMLIDDLGAGDVGCYGSTEHETPQLDRLAAEGMRFETCFATPLCTPTRVQLMTGQHGFRTGYFNLIHNEWTPVRPTAQYFIGDKFTFADLVKTQGYATACAGKWQLSLRNQKTQVFDCGFDEYLIWAKPNNLPKDVRQRVKEEGLPNSRFWQPTLMKNGEYVATGPDEYGPDQYVGFLADFARRHTDQPFFLYYSMALTHRPWRETPDPGNPGNRRPEGLKSNVEYCDFIIGQMADAIEAAGLTESTLLVIVGDNGTATRGKGVLTEEGCRVPFVVRCPGTVKRGVVSRELTSTADIFPTMAAYAGAAIPESHVVDGASLRPILEGELEQRQAWIYSFLEAGRLLRDRRWLYYTDKETGERVSMFDCGNSRDGTGYLDVTGSSDADVLAARTRFEKLLEDLPGPKDHPDLVQPSAELEQRKQQRIKELHDTF